MSFTCLSADLFRWTDTCNCYVLRDGDAALLIDLGDGSVLPRLADIGVQRVEWVLFTHHHREQCQGAPRLRGTGAKVAVPAAERALFEAPASFRKMHPALDDPFTVYGASYVRPPVEPVAVDRAFARMDTFAWRGREFVCAHAGGDSPGHMAYLLKRADGWVAFTGDLMLAGATMHAWFDVEWDYGFGKGLYELGNAAAYVAGYDPVLLLPGHGPEVRDGRARLAEYVGKLRRLGEVYPRGYDLARFAGCDQDTVSRPTAVPHVWRVTPHLYKFRGPDYWVNFTLLLADSGRGLVIDCGLFDRDFLDRALAGMTDRLGLKGIDAVFVTHMHGDHALDADHVRRKYGAKLWTLEGVADKFERPFDHDFAALLPAYTVGGKRPGPLSFDRVVRDGETIHWEGYALAADWMPGQTKYHACLHGVIDGKRVAFTGDNIFGSPSDPRQAGTEAVVARNGCVLEEGYLRAADYLHTLGPDLLVGGHSWVMADPAALIGRYRQRALDLRAAFQALTADDYRYLFDPYWVRAAPYRVTVRPGGSANVTILVRNFRDRDQAHRVAVHCPPGLSAAPGEVAATVPAEFVRAYPVTVTAAADARPGLHIVALDVTRDGRRLGQLFDFVVNVG